MNLCLTNKNVGYSFFFFVPNTGMPRKGSFDPKLLNNLLPYCFLINYDFFYYYTLHIFLKAFFLYLSTFFGFYFLYLFYTSNSLVTMLYKEIKIFHELLKSSWFFLSCHHILLIHCLLKPNSFWVMYESITTCIYCTNF